MTKYSVGMTNVRAFRTRNWMFEIEPYPKMPIKTFDEVNDDLNLRSVLKRAVMRDHAPQSLIDSIKAGIKG